MPFFGFDTVLWEAGKDSAPMELWAIFGHLSISFGAAAQDGGSSDSLNSLWEASKYEYSPWGIKTTRLPQHKPMLLC